MGHRLGGDSGCLIKGRGLGLRRGFGNDDVARGDWCGARVETKVEMNLVQVMVQ